MPPKKKGKKGAKDGKKKGKDGDLSEGDKLKMKSHEVDSLKDNLALRKDFSRRSKAAFEDLKDKLEETHLQIEEISSTHKASNAYLTHQYKTLQVFIDPFSLFQGSFFAGHKRGCILTFQLFSVVQFRSPSMSKLGFMLILDLAKIDSNFSRDQGLQ